MSSLNKVMLIGRLGKDPELRYTSSGKAVCDFSLATGDGRREREQVEWHRIVAWEKTAELCNQYLGKGSQVYVEGRIQTRRYTDKDGGERSVTEIVAQHVTFLGQKGEGGRADSAPAPADKGKEQRRLPEPLDDDDIPF